MRFLFKIIFILKSIKFHFKGSYDKQDLTLVVISYEEYNSRMLVSTILYEIHLIRECEILCIFAVFAYKMDYSTLKYNFGDCLEVKKTRPSDSRE